MADDILAGDAAGLSMESKDGDGGDPEECEAPTGVRDLVTKEGFQNDGYDYGKHLREFGAGTFVGKGGVAVEGFGAEDALSRRVPAMPEQEAPEVDRGLDAICLDDRHMDEEMRACLNGEDGEFEELADDFVMSAMMGEAEEAFDYEAHIAALMEAAGDEEEDDDEAFATGASALSHMGGGGGGGGAQRAQRLVDERFDVTLARQYDDGQIGELDDLYGEDEMAGAMGDESDLMMMALAEFADEKAEMEAGFATLNEERATEGDGRGVGNKETAVAVERLIAAGGAAASPYGVGGAGGEAGGEGGETKGVDEAGEAEEAEEEERDGGVGEGVSSGRGDGRLNDPDYNQEAGSDAEGEDRDRVDDGGQPDFEYLKERPRDKWDCETIVSTYSTTDNIPSMLKAPLNDKSRGARRKRQYELEKAENAADRARKAAAAAAREAAMTKGSKKIVLSKKTGMPIKPQSGGVSKESKDDAAGAEAVAGATAGAGAGTGAVGFMSLAAMGDDSDDGADLDLDDDGGETGMLDGLNMAMSGVKGTKRDKNESAEEKKMRKKLVKAQRAAARVRKKDLKNVYKEEEARQNLRGTMASGDTAAHSHVFRYS
jgi:hypothetical protein